MLVESMVTVIYSAPVSFAVKGPGTPVDFEQICKTRKSFTLLKIVNQFWELIFLELSPTKLKTSTIRRNGQGLVMVELQYQNKRARKKKPISKIDANDETSQDGHWAAKRIEWKALSGELMEYNQWQSNGRPKGDRRKTTVHRKPLTIKIDKVEIVSA